MQKMKVLDSNDNELFVGTKQECMHFIKCRKLNRAEIKVRGVGFKPVLEPVLDIEPEPASHNWLKRMFKK